MSVLLGGVFLGIRWKYWIPEWSPHFEQDNVSDRMGFIHVIMSVGVWPMLLTMISEAWMEKLPMTRDVEDGLYSKFAYIITKVFFFCFSIIIVFPYLIIISVVFFNFSDRNFVSAADCSEILQD